MTGACEFSYSDCELVLRADLVASHRRSWERLARPGAWWTGSERVAIAAEVRAAYDCDLCARRKRSLAAGAVEGAHTTASQLPTAAVEVIHRITTDPGRLSRTWYERALDDGLTPEAYVELLGTLVALISIDRFAEAIGIAHRELPPPRGGEPTRYRPPTATMEDAWVPLIPSDGNDPPEDDLWVRGRGGNVIRAMSLVPDEVRTLNDLGAAHYMANHMVLDVAAAPDRALDRAQIELIAARVSALNECFY